MAMTQSQITTELKRKASIGQAPSNPANLGQYNQMMKYGMGNTAASGLGTVSNMLSSIRSPITQALGAGLGQVGKTVSAVSNAPTALNMVGKVMTGVSPIVGSSLQALSNQMSNNPGYIAGVPSNAPNSTIPVAAPVAQQVADPQTAEYLRRISALESQVNQLQQPQQNPVDSDVINYLKIIGEKLNAPRTTPYDEQISSLLGTLSQRIGSPTQYNPNTDQALKMAQDQAMNQAYGLAARKNMLYSDSAKSQALSRGQELIPQYQQLAEGREQQNTQNLGNQLQILSQLQQTAENRDQQGLDNLYKQLNALSNVANTDYNRARDTITDTGKLPTGEYTQQGLMNQLDTDTAKLKLEELINPNSTTNRLNKLKLNTAELEFSTLSQQMKDKATGIALDLETKKINNQTAQEQLKEITDKNSTTNRFNKLKMDISAFDFSQMPIKAKQEADKVASDLESQRINRQIAQAQIDNLNKGLTKEGKHLTATKEEYNSNYEDAKIQYANVNNEEVRNELVKGEKTIINQIGSKNYNELVKWNQNNYYNQIILDWRDSPQRAIIDSLNSNPNYYKERIGLNNYNKLYKDAKKVVDKDAKEY